MWKRATWFSWRAWGGGAVSDLKETKTSAIRWLNPFDGSLVPLE